MKLINLTNHDVTIIQWDDEQRTLPSNGLLRVFSRHETIGEIKYDGVTVPLLEISEQTVEKAPVDEDILYVVSGIAAAKAHRPDFIVPSRIVREGGSIKGCQAFARIKLPWVGE